jgi:dienelactone hydrolase
MSVWWPRQTGLVHDHEGRREQLREFLQLPSMPPSAELILHSEDPQRDWTRVAAVVRTDAEDIPAWVAIPQGRGPFPAVVIFHQHAGQREFGKSEPFGLVGDRFQAFAPALARAGVLVIAADSIAFEDRRTNGVRGVEPHPDDFLQHFNAMTYRLVTGDTLMRTVLQDARATLSAVADLPQVISDRIGVVGHSYGGNTAMFLAAIDERVGFTCASGAVCSYRHKVAVGTGLELAMAIPGFTTQFDVEDLLASAAPHPFLIVSSDDDPYSADAPDVERLARPAYEACGAGARLQHLRVPGPHALDATRFQAITGWLTQRCADPK